MIKIVFLIKNIFYIAEQIFKITDLLWDKQAQKE